MHDETPTADEAEQIANYSRETYDEYLSEYKSLYTTVSETERRRVFADEHGHELGEWADDLGLSRGKVAAWMHEQADGVDYNWSASDPVVLLKGEN